MTRPQTNAGLLESLEQAVVRMQPDVVVALASGMSERDREAVAAGVVELEKSLVVRGDEARYRRCNQLDPRLTRHLVTPFTAAQLDHEIPRAMAFVASLARYAFCGERMLPPSTSARAHQADAIVAVLLDRRPPWLEHWLRAQLSKPVERQVIDWLIVRALVKADVLTRPLPDGYYALLASPWTRDRDPSLGPAALLRADPGLLEHEVWELFERDTRAFRRDVYFDRGWDWSSALGELAGTGELDRGKLLAAAERALAAGFKATTKRGLTALIEKLRPKAPRAKSKRVIPAPPACWEPTWEPIEHAQVSLSERAAGAVFMYRAGPFTCLTVKISNDCWLESRGLGESAESDAVTAWRRDVADPPRTKSSYLGDAVVLLRMGLVPESLRILRV